MRYQTWSAAVGVPRGSFVAPKVHILKPLLIVLIAAVLSVPLQAQVGNVPAAPVGPAPLPNIKAAEPSPSVSGVVVQKAAWDVLTKGLADHKSGTRTYALMALSNLAASPRALAMVESALNDKSAAVREQAAMRLGDMGARSSIPKLKRMLSDRSPEVSFAAARTLTELGDDGGRDQLIEVLTGERRISGALAASGLGVWTREQGPLNLLLMGASQASSILIGPYVPLAILAVRQLASGSPDTERAMSAESLGSDGSARAIEVLRHALRDHNWNVRAAAASALGMTTATATVPELTRLLKDKKPAVRFMAAASIIRLTAPSAPLWQGADWMQPSQAGPSE